LGQALCEEKGNLQVRYEMEEDKYQIGYENVGKKCMKNYNRKCRKNYKTRKPSAQNFRKPSDRATGPI